MQEAYIRNPVVKAVGDANTKSGATVLDLSCGDGDIITVLAEKDYNVQGTHFKDDDYIFDKPSAALNTATIHKGVDLTKPLPFADGSFDFVLATEVLEHLQSHAPIVSEVGRILGEGGHFIFTTPNVHRLCSRWQFFLTGTHNLCGARLGWNVPREGLYSTHFNPVYFPVMHTLLHHNKMDVTRLYLTTCRPLDCLFFPLLYPFLAAATGFEMTHFAKKSRIGAKNLLRWMLDPHLLLSKQLVVVARKTD
jgi:2-polyprenyl-3-methyl-5-hydroxy-6-metoxy-1,4-benzoquinol methylase